ncbi:hypothetical protein [Amycolatopsis australiensis]|uniref:Uncharacterized protein n=1 Tax=Amycolatopsis australiensis TaxID=546364 RepID=A0A1K1PH61_9PSEU|nr:hypothetical protein [Amycolatopsis australiensis]SFW46781.1 hypothetical protein SAMN04489730_0613 [Amycolatopsis australiensis]
MAEQRDDGKPGSDIEPAGSSTPAGGNAQTGGFPALPQPGGSSAPGQGSPALPQPGGGSSGPSQGSPALPQPGGGAPAPSQRPPALPQPSGTPAQPPIDPAELERFRQFQQFQDYLRFTQAQQGNQPAPYPDAGMVQAPPSQPPMIPPGYQLVPAERRRAPKWLSWLGKKVIAWVLAIVILGVAATWLYNHFFPNDSGKSSAQLAQEGGGTYHTNHVFSKSPYEAVRMVYQDIAQGSVEDACGRFAYDAGKYGDIQTKFAQDLGQNDCRQAVQAIHAQVQPKDRNDYAESVPSYVSEPLPGDVVTIDSCSFPITGGPALGVFTVTKVEMGQWLITRHAPGPAKCAGAPTTTPTS